VTGRTTSVRAAMLVSTVVLATACGSTGTPQASYVFKPDHSPVKVDTPQLRAEKAAAGIENCPRSRPPTRAEAAGAAARTMPRITLPCLGGGRSVDLAGLTGTPTVVNFWAQSCGPCRAESPILQRVHEAARGRLRVIGVDWEDSQPGMAIAFARQLGLTYPQLADPEAATRKPLGIAGLPVSVFLDPSGRIVHANYGAVTSARELTALVSRYLHVDVQVPGR
jgi:cytochrome c biogenesis protein CcmG, thiol:disulfide interchange protein DsbE